MQPRRDRKSLVGKLQCWLEKLRPRQSAMFFVRQFEHAQEAGRADTLAAEHDFAECARCAVGFQKPFGRCCCRRCLAPVVALQLPRLLIPVQQEAAAAEPGRLRLDDKPDRVSRVRCRPKMPVLCAFCA